MMCHSECCCVKSDCLSSTSGINAFMSLCVCFAKQRWRSLALLLKSDVPPAPYALPVHHGAMARRSTVLMALMNYIVEM